MDEQKPRSFTAATAARLASFISFREALTKLIAGTGDTPGTVARGVKAAGLDAEHIAQVSGDGLSVGTGSSGQARVGALLDALIKHCDPGPVWLWSKAGVDITPDRYGWLRESFIETLRASNLPCPDSLSAPSDDQPRVSPPATPDTEAVLRQRLEAAEAENEKLRQQLELAQQESERLRTEGPSAGGLLRPIIVEVGREFWSPG